MSTTPTQLHCDVKNLELADLGKKRIEWANQSMKVLQIIRKEFIKNQPLKGMRVSACLHVTTETANLAITLRDGGADVVLCASNPLSTQDDVAASLVRDYDIPIFAIKGEDNDTYYSHIMAAIDHKPHITMDDGADLVTMLHTKRQDALRRRDRRHRGDDHRRHPPARHGQGRRAALPHHRGQRRRHQAPVRQPLRHRPVHHRRHHPRHQRAAGRLEVRGRRLRLVRPRPGHRARAAWAPTSSSPKWIPRRRSKPSWTASASCP